MKVITICIEARHEDGSAYFNTKITIHLITNELKKNIQENKTTESEHIAYLRE